MDLIAWGGSMFLSRWIGVALCFLVGELPASALEPRDIFLLVNKNVPASQEIADHYCKARGVPRANILVFDLPTGEEISRKQYDSQLVGPLRKTLQDQRDRAKVLVSTYGVPLRVGRLELSDKDKMQADHLQAKINQWQAKLKDLRQQLKDEEAKKAGDKEPRRLRDEIKTAEEQLKGVESGRRYLVDGESTAAVDSELMLLWWDNYELRKWQINMLYWQISDKVRLAKPPVVMVARLDGPTLGLIKKLIDTSVQVEKKGLAGKVYVDARGFKYTAGKSSATDYDAYDESLREMARLLEKEAKLQVTLDDRPELFAPGSCPEAALYCGWYSHARYIDCCKFVPGAVAYHIASSEAMSLRDPKATYWCKNLLDNGVVATLGPVAEPYTIGFPKPAEFFGFLVTGEYTLVECYSRTALLASWMTTLVGDPLYNPYKATPKLRPAQVQPSPAGGKTSLIPGM
jgi:uncharacterized protein (TIGR03790 family)